MQVYRVTFSLGPPSLTPPLPCPVYAPGKIIDQSFAWHFVLLLRSRPQLSAFSLIYNFLVFLSLLLLHGIYPFFIPFSICDPPVSLKIKMNSNHIPLYTFIPQKYTFSGQKFKTGCILN